MFSTSGLTFAFLFVFFAACAADDPFPFIIDRLQTHLRGANQSLALLKQGSFPVFQGLLNLKNYLSAATSDVGSLPHNVSSYLVGSSDSISISDSIWNASKSIDGINHHFVCVLKSKKAQSMEDVAVINQLIHLMNEMVLGVVDPYTRLLYQWSADLQKSSSIDTIDKIMATEKRFRSAHGQILFNLFKLTPVFMNIQDNKDGWDSGTEVRESAGKLLSSICRTRIEVVCIGEDCDRFISDVVKFFKYCDN